MGRGTTEKKPSTLVRDLCSKLSLLSPDLQRDPLLRVALGPERLLGRVEDVRQAVREDGLLERGKQWREKIMKYVFKVEDMWRFLRIGN